MTILETQQLCKIYGSLTAVDSVDLELQSGQIVGLIEIGRASCRERV